MNEKEVKERLEDLIDTCNKGIEMHPYDKELFETDREAIGTALQLLDQKDKRIDDLEKALVEEAIKSTEKIKELNKGINTLMIKRKKWKNRYYKSKNIIYELLKILEE